MAQGVWEITGTFVLENLSLDKGRCDFLSDTISANLVPYKSNSIMQITWPSLTC